MRKISDQVWEGLKILVEAGSIKVKLPEGWEGWTEEQRLVYLGRDFLETMREMYDDLHIGLVKPDFDRWVDAAPIEPGMRKAVQLAQEADNAEERKERERRCLENP